MSCSGRDKGNSRCCGLGVGMCLEKFWNTKLNVLQQLLALAGGLCLIYPGIVTDVVGIAMVGAVMLWQWRQAKPAR